MISPSVIQLLEGKVSMKKLVQLATLMLALGGFAPAQAAGVAAMAAAISVSSIGGAAGSVGSVQPNLAGLDSGPNFGVPVSGLLFPADTPVAEGQGIMRIRADGAQLAVLLVPDPMGQAEESPIGKSESEDLRSTPQELFQVFKQKKVRVITEPALRAELTQLEDYHRPIEFTGRVSDRVSPMLTIDSINLPR